MGESAVARQGGGVSFTVTLYGPKHHFWKHRWDIWFFRPDKDSTGGVGFKVPGLHVCFMWGKK